MKVLSIDYVTSNAWDRQFGGDREATITCLNPHDPDEPLVYSTYLGGSGNEYNAALLLLPDNKALVADYTDSRDYPVTFPSRYQGGASDIALTLLDLDDPESESFGQALWSCYLGGSGEDFFRQLVLGRRLPTADWGELRHDRQRV